MQTLSAVILEIVYPLIISEVSPLTPFYIQLTTLTTAVKQFIKRFSKREECKLETHNSKVILTRNYISQLIIAMKIHIFKHVIFKLY